MGGFIRLIIARQQQLLLLLLWFSGGSGIHVQAHRDNYYRQQPPPQHTQRQHEQRTLPRYHPKSPGYRMLQEEQQQQQQTTNTEANDESSTVENLRASLLENYDRLSFPFDKLWASDSSTETDNGGRRGVQVQVGLNFHRVFEVDVTRSVADMIVWVRQVWNDPRLRWDTSLYNGTMHFWIGDGQGGGETSEIWTPDLQLWNQETPLDTSLADAHALVSSDGTVFWSRPGHIKPVCKFEGLGDFPFDTLACTLEIGSWAYSGLYVRPVKLDEGFSVGGSTTAGEAFAEYRLDSVAAEEFVYPPFPAAPEEDWPVLFYTITFQRAWQPYVRGYLVLQIILNLAAFCSFWLPPHLGERMSLTITAVLAAVASELVVSAKLPSASEITWFAKFSIGSLIFASAALFESCVVIYFYYHTGDDLVPKWYRAAKSKGEAIIHNSKKRNERGGFPSSRTSCRRESSQGVRFKEKPETNETAQSQAFSSVESSPADDKQETGPSRRADDGDQHEHSSFEDDDGGNDNIDDCNHYESSEDGCSSRGQQSLDEVPEELPQHVNGNDDTRENKMNRMQAGTSFSSSLQSFRTRKRVKTILGRDADDFKNAKEMENNIRWQAIARSIDSFSRVFFPAAFTIYLAITFAGVDL